MKTGLKGGGGSLDWFSLLFMFLLIRARALRRAGLIALSACGATFAISSANAADASDQACIPGEAFTDGCWSAGLGWYLTALEPDDSRSTWRVVDDSDAGYKLSVEYRFFERWFIELGYADMGAATVVSRNPAILGSEPVDYKVPSLLGGYLLFDPARRVNVHVKAGYASLQTDAVQNIIDEQIKSHQIVLAAGIRARVVKRLQVLVEYEYYDKDAQQVGVAARYLF